tara:strand:- start:668 stop:850 length:183 start_codon:yes stop_codon:yes gene_type:complete
VKVGDLVKNLHGLLPVSVGIVIEISEPQLTNPNACPYMVHWFDGTKPAWMRADWLEIISD